MIYTERTKSAICIAFEAHQGQTDKAGLPYITHPLHLAEQMHDEDTCVVALLHDVLEDTLITPQELLTKGVTEVQIEALLLLKHNKKLPYLEYVRNLKHNRIARIVKLTDLKHNSDLSRLDCITEKDQRRAKKYAEAIALLSEETL